jgi:phosphomannomutase
MKKVGNKQQNVSVVPHWNRCEVTRIDAQAIHAMHTGTATPEQQATFMKWLTSKASPTLGLAFDPDSERASVFESGRRFVGLKIIEVVKTPIDYYGELPNG